MSLRVALVHPYSWTEVRRGGERYLSDLAWYLAEAGHEVDAIVSAPGAATVQRIGDVTVRAYRRVEPGWLVRRGLTAIETHGAVAALVLARRRYDVVHALTPTGALAGVVSRHRTIYSELGHPTAEDLAARRGARAIYAQVMRRATVVTGLSRSAAAAMEAVSGRTAEVLPAGVRLDVFAAHPQPPFGAPRILFLGDASVSRKGVDLALAALDLVLDRHPDARLQLGGPGDHLWAVPALGDRADRVLAAVDVLGVGERDELPARYRQATVTIMPSEHEAFGLVLAESLACGTPVVCTAEGGMREVAEDPGVSRAFPPRDVPALAWGILDMIDVARDPGTAARCVAGARRWGWSEIVGPTHEALYRRTVGQERRRAGRK